VLRVFDPATNPGELPALRRRVHRTEWFARGEHRTSRREFVSKFQNLLQHMGWRGLLDKRARERAGNSRRVEPDLI
jgi:hypothetical protein